MKYVEKLNESNQSWLADALIYPLILSHCLFIETTVKMFHFESLVLEDFKIHPFRIGHGRVQDFRPQGVFTSGLRGQQIFFE